MVRRNTGSDGSIVDLGDGRFRIFASAGKDANGKRVRPNRVITGTKKDAVRELRAMKYSLDENGPRSSMRFSSWIKIWLKQAGQKRAPRTMAEYRRLLDARILPQLGARTLNRLDPQHIAEFLQRLAVAKHARKNQRLSGHSQLKYYLLISVILQDAVYAGLLPSNPARQVRPPKMERHRAEYYEQDDVQVLWQALMSEPLMWRAVIATVLLLGIRRGELMALRWGDIHFDRSFVIIERAAYKVAGANQAVKPPKTASSVRAVPMPEELVTILQEWREKQGGAPEDYIAAPAPGEWLFIDAPTKWFRKFLARHGLRSLPLHGLRHTVATVMLESGVPLRAVSEHLGHARSSTTSDTYAHATSRAMEQAKSAISSILAQKTAHPSAIDIENIS